MSSDFLLRVALSGWQIMKNFSSRQRLHFFVRFEYDWAFPSVFHVSSIQNNMEDTRKGPIIFKPDKKMQPLRA